MGVRSITTSGGSERPATARTARTIGATGPGTTTGRRLDGTTGCGTSLTTGTASSASLSSSWPTRWVTGFTTGTTGTARPWRGTFARNLQTRFSLVIYIAKYILILR